eukprot:7881003-Alexandrium_andersonii.AAC.1
MTPSRQRRAAADVRTRGARNAAAGEIAAVGRPVVTKRTGGATWATAPANVLHPRPGRRGTRLSPRSWVWKR